MTQYLMAVHHDFDAPLPADMEQIYADVDAFNKKLTDAGAWVFGGGLEAPSTATVLRAEGGEILTTDGPFAEVKEHLGGFWVIEAPDLDAALEWGSQAAVACRNPIEVRPFQAE
ncbi:MAG TPA: YciI family protein [Actinomycetota bacterium]|nr:YciI family protein [Actinomycetota bacterium]